MRYRARLLAWFRAESAAYFSFPLSLLVTGFSYAYHWGPYRWMMELQAKIFDGSYGPVMNVALIMLFVHWSVCAVGALFGSPPPWSGLRAYAVRFNAWHAESRWSFYGLLLGTMFVGLGAWNWGKAAWAGDLVLAKASRVPATASWVYLDGTPLWDQSVKKQYATYVPYVDPKSPESPGIIVSSGGDLGLQQMQTAQARDLGIEVLEAWDGMPPDVRAYFVEHGLEWAETAKVYAFGQSPKKQSSDGRLFLGIGLLLVGLGWWRRPR